MNTDGFLWLLRAKDDKHDEVRELRRSLAVAERELADFTQQIEAETKPRAEQS